MKRPAAQSHDQVQQLLPWLVNGSLAADELEVVNQHIEHCPHCAASLERELALARALNRAPGALERLLQQQADSLERVRVGTASARRSHRSFRYAALAGVLCILAVTLVVSLTQRNREARYHTLTDRASQETPVVQLVFHPATPEREIRRLLNEVGASLVAGPSDAGVYRIRLARPAQADAALARLRADPAVELAVMEQ